MIGNWTRLFPLLLLTGGVGVFMPTIADAANCPRTIALYRKAADAEDLRKKELLYRFVSPFFAAAISLGVHVVSKEGKQILFYEDFHIAVLCGPWLDRCQKIYGRNTA